VIIGSVGPAGA